MSLRRRLIVVMLLLLAGVLLPLGAYLGVRVQAFARVQATRALDSQLAVIARDGEGEASSVQSRTLLEYEVFSLALSRGTWGLVITPQGVQYSDSGVHPRPPERVVRAVQRSGGGTWDGLQLARAGDAVIGLALRESEISALTRDVLLAYSLGALLAFGLAGGLGVGLLGLGLAPLQNMARRSAQLSAASLDERLPVPDTRDEVQTLALSLNAMLGRLEETFSRLEAAEVRTRQFAADASHELRTPITALSAGLDVLERVGDDPQARDRVLSSLRREARRAGRLVGDLLLLGRLEAGEPLQQVWLALPELLSALAQTAADLAPQRQFTVVAPPAQVCADRARLEDALWNLIRNAVTATPDGAQIVLWSRAEDGGVALGVRNSGHLPDELRPRLFDRFVRGAASGEGSGLGLAIVRATALAHGGSVFAHNLPSDSGQERQVEIGLHLPGVQPTFSERP